MRRTCATAYEAQHTSLQITKEHILFREFYGIEGYWFDEAVVMKNPHSAQANAHG
jgi:hypothetical protein